MAKEKPHPRLTPTTKLINELRRENLDLKRKNKALRSECRLLRVSKYAEARYADHYVRLHDSGAVSDRRPSSPGDGSAS